MTRIRLATVLLAGVIGACHFDDSFQIDAKVDPGRPGAEHREACTERAAASCAYVARCYAYDFERAWPDLATCVDRVMLACQLDASDAPSNVDDSIRACTVPADFPCPSDPAHEAALAELRERCPEPKGELPNGSDCGSDLDCASGYCGRDGAAGACPTCLPDPCAPCTEDQRCVHQVSGSVTCIDILEDGASCIDDLTCASLYCASSVCTPSPAEGEPCEPHGSSCNGSAEVHLFCNPSTLRCERVALLEAGQNCQGAAIGAVDCGGGTVCLPHAATLTCVEPAADGAPCFASQGLGCVAPASCVDGFCRFVHSSDPCSPD